MKKPLHDLNQMFLKGTSLRNDELKRLIAVYTTLTKNLDFLDGEMSLFRVEMNKRLETLQSYKRNRES